MPSGVLRHFLRDMALPKPLTAAIEGVDQGSQRRGAGGGGGRRRRF